MNSFSFPDETDTVVSVADQTPVVLSLLQGLKEKVMDTRESAGVFKSETGVITLSGDLKKQLRLIQKELSRLLEQCVGKPARPVEIRRHLERISSLIGTLDFHEGASLRRWAAGEIQAEMVSELDATATEILRIQEWLEGTASGPGAVGLFSGMASGAARFLADLFTPALLVVKLVVLVAALISAGLFYLWWTMDREEDLALKITTLSAQISARQELIRRFNEEISRLEKAIEGMEEGEGGRSGKVALVELQLKAQGAREGREKIAGEILHLERSLAELEKRLGEIRNRSFLERLFRLSHFAS
jgi:hypothetical protein